MTESIAHATARQKNGYTRDMPPGTEIVDPSGKEEHVHYPTPSNHLDDPLNWSRTWKWITYSSSLWYLFWSTFPYIGITSLYAPLIQEFGFTIQKVSEFTAYTGLLNGIGNFIWIPLARKFGRRSSLLASTLGSIACSVWFPFAKSYSSMLASRCMLGLFMAPVECFAPMIIADLFFTSERSRLHSLLFINLLVATNAGGAVSGAFADSKSGWRSFFYFNAAMLASVFLALFFLHPETSYRRPLTTPTTITLPAELKTRASDDDNEDVKEKVPVSPQVGTVDLEEGTVALVGKGSPTTKQKYGLIEIDPEYSVIDALTRVLAITVLSPVWLAVGWFAACKGILVGQSYVAAQIWQVAPYHFSNAQVGMTNIPAIIGTITGCVTWGWLSDWDLARRTRINGGLREPEMRLWLIIPAVILGSIGGEVYAFGAEKKWHWAVLLVPGVALNFFGFVGALIIGLSYSIDSYNRQAGEIGLLMATVGNVWIFGVGYFINDMLATQGFGRGLTYMQVPCWFMLAISCIFIVFGKRLRWATAGHYLLRK